MKHSRFSAIAAILACALIASACANTVRGVKNDVENTADAVTE